MKVETAPKYSNDRALDLNEPLCDRYIHLDVEGAGDD